MQQGILPRTSWRADLAIVFLALILTVGLAPTAQAAPWTTPPAPVLVGGQAATGTPGNIYMGAVPPGAASKPVLVFVHGKNNQAANWWTDTVYHGHNDMYDYAYNYGYRTAFVDLADVAGTGATMWTNGQLLRNQLDTIANYYGVSSLNVVAHSKGGVDTQTAIVHYGAGPRVQTVFTLSSPHWGSPVADLAYSSWTWWLAALLGELNDSTYVMQTGYMSWFRSITDGRPENNNTHYYTSGGTSWGPTLSALWFGGSYLSFYGSNDGLVPVSNAYNPRGTHIFTRDLDHDNIRMGSTVFPTVNNYVNTLWRAGASAEPAAGAPGNPLAATGSSSILRGGPIPAGGSSKTGVARDQIPVEPGATHLALDLLSNVADLDLRWTAPNGKVYTAKAVRGVGEVFGQAYHYQVAVDAPAAGTWRLVAAHSGAQAAAYLLAAQVQSPVAVAITRDPARTFAPGAGLPIQVRATDAAGRQVISLQVMGTMALDGKGATTPFAVQGAGAYVAPTVVLPKATGVANLSITVRGQLSDGSNFEREAVISVPVVAKGAGLTR